MVRINKKKICEKTSGLKKFQMNIRIKKNIGGYLMLVFTLADMLVLIKYFYDRKAMLKINVQQTHIHHPSVSLPAPPE